jgi:hypothetical protein
MVVQYNEHKFIISHHSESRNGTRIGRSEWSAAPLRTLQA